MNIDYNPYLFSSLFVILGIIFIGSGIILNKRKIRIVEMGVRTKGEVVDIIKELISIENTPTESDYTYFPVVKYKTIEGVLFKEKDKTGVSYLSNLKIGDEVDIIYDNANPKNFIIFKPGYLLQGILFIMIGTVFFLLGIFFLLNNLTNKYPFSSHN